MAIALRACTAAPNTAGGNGSGFPTASVVLNKPTGTVSGDLLIVCVTIDGTTSSNYSTPTWTPPSGWTQLDTVSNTGVGGFVFYKIAGGSEPSSYTFTKSESTQWSDASIAAYSGVDNTTPFDVTGSHAVGTAAISCPSITTVTNGAQLILCGGNWAGTTPTLQAGFTNRSNQTDGNVLADKAQASAGATGTASYSAGSTPQVAFLLALRPAGSGVTTNQTLTSTARITATTTKTLTSTARVTATAQKTLTSVARIQLTTAKTLTSVARVTAVTTKTLGAIARITAITQKTLTSVARVQTTIQRTMTATARITAVASKTLTSVARITATTQKTLTSVAHIVVAGTTTRTLNSVTRITVTSTQTRTATARIRATVTRTLNSVAHIFTPVMGTHVHSATVADTRRQVAQIADSVVQRAAVADSAVQIATITDQPG